MNYKSIQIRIIVPFIVVVATFLLGFGWISYTETHTQLNQQLQIQAENSLQRLKLSLPEPVWNYDLEFLTQSIELEMNANFMAGIVVKNENENLLFRIKDPQGKVVDATTIPNNVTFSLTSELHYDDGNGKQQVGEVTVFINDSNIRSALSQVLRKLATEIIVLEIAITALMYFLLSRIVLRPMQQNIRSALDIAASGDFRQRLDTHRGDEISQLGEGINHFICKLQEVIGKVSTTSERVLKSVSATASISHEANADLRKQMDEIHSVATATLQVSHTNEMVAQSATTASNSANEVRHLANNSSQIVNKAVQAIETLAEKVEHTTNVLQRLETEGEKIGTVTVVIKDIADQTNLLALNAAIEAARAGEQGRGFAVVADEVRTLAQRTQVSTNEINHIIERLQASSKDAVKIMIDAMTQVHNGVEEASQAESAIGEITPVIASVSDMNAQIASASEEQSSAVNEINQNIEMILKVSEETVERAVQTALSSQDSAQLAAELRQQIAHFKV